MKNKTIANWLIGSLVACMVGAVLEGESTDLSALMYAAGGIGVWLFGVVAIFRLYKSKEA